MTSIDDLILQSTNPFDNYRSENFWRTQVGTEPVVESIHTEVIAAVTETLNKVAQDRHTRTLLLQGDPGSGKTYLLGRLKKTLNDKAFFAYINPFPQSSRIWWHILRYTVDSLVQVPAGQKDSQLMQWLKSLSVFTKRTLTQRLIQDNFWEGLTSDRQKFIKHLKKTYKNSAIYNPDSFFGVLHDLINPKKHDLACEWLRGEDLSDESLKELGVKSSIDTEEAACETLANFGRIATETQPIVLCFDQIESIARLPNNSPDLQTLFSVATKIHGESKNFLLIISINIDTWQNNKNHIDQSHKDRIDLETYLKPISLIEAESILATRLYSLHRQANPQPKSNTYPVDRQSLLEQFPRGRTNPREILIFGRDTILSYKKWLAEGSKGVFKPLKAKKPDECDRSELIASFKIKWIEELTKAQQQITKLQQQSSPELIKMLQEALISLGMENVKIPLLLKTTKFANYSLSYKVPKKPEGLGVVWTEDQNMNTFFHIMEACRKSIEGKLCQNLYLIRDSKLGNQNTKGYRLYAQLFHNTYHRQIHPKIASIQYLVAYYELVKDAKEGDLTLSNGKAINLKELRQIAFESKIFHGCYLLQKLKIVPDMGDEVIEDMQVVKDFLFNVVFNQQLLGKEILIGNTISYFPWVNKAQINQLIEQLCEEGKIGILGSPKKPQEQLVCLLVAKAS